MGCGQKWERERRPHRGESAYARPIDAQLQDVLNQAAISWRQLPDPQRIEVETAWLRVYGHAFRGRPRLRHGPKAEQEYLAQACGRYVIVPFSAGVTGLPINVHGLAIAAYECRGPLVALGAFCSAEFFISPPDLAWAMIHTHEDHAFGGPYFIRADWIPRSRNQLRPGFRLPPQ